MILPDILMFALALLAAGGASFLLICFIMTLSDFECDYINGPRCCSILNFWSIPKFGADIMLTTFLCIECHFGLVLINLPIILLQIYKFVKKPLGNIGIYDPTEIYNRNMIQRHLTNCAIYLAFHVTMFFVYMYYLIKSLIDYDVSIKYHDQDEIVTAF